VLTIRPLRTEDRPAARALLAAEGTRHAYAARAIEILDAVTAARENTEYDATVAEEDRVVVGVVLHGTVAGSVGAGMLYGGAVAPTARRRGVGRALVEGAVASLAAAGSRVVFAELPDAAALADVQSLLRRSGFAETGRVADLVRDGVAMVVWRREAEGVP